MGRDLHCEMAVAAQSLAETGKIGTSSQRKLSQIFSMCFEPHPPETGKPDALKPARKGPKRPRGEVEKIYRISKARKVYYKALHRGSCYFIAFALCVTATDCRDPEIALFPEQDERGEHIQFALHKDTLSLFKSWARFNRYDSNERFVNFVEKLPETPGEGLGTAPHLDIATDPDIDRQLAKDGLISLPESPRTKALLDIPLYEKPCECWFMNMISKVGGNGYGP